MPTVARLLHTFLHDVRTQTKLNKFQTKCQHFKQNIQVIKVKSLLGVKLGANALKYMLSISRAAVPQKVITVLAV